MGEDDEGEAGEEKAGYVGDAEAGAAVETGKHSSEAAGLWGSADKVYRWGTVVVGRNGQNDLVGAIASFIRPRLILEGQP